MVEGCNGKIDIKKPTALAAHLRNAHHELYLKAAKDSEINKIAKNKGKQETSKKIGFSKEAFIKALVVEATTLSFNHFKLSHFHQLITKTLAQNLGVKKVLNKENIKLLVKLAAKDVRSHISKELQEQPSIHLKCDLATRNRRALMGINAQYCLNGQIIVRKLATYEIDSKSTAQNLLKLLSEVKLVFFKF